jgi:rod shape-determining protein MreD
VKTFLALLLAGLCALMLEGVLARVFPPPWCPDLGFLVVVSIGLCLRGLIPGLLLAYLLGSSIDVLSGSLAGLHALLCVISFVSAFFAASQLNLKSTLSLMAFVGSLSFVYGVLLFFISSLFVENIGLSWRWILENFLHAWINGLTVPFVVEGIGRLVAWSEDDDSQERSLYIDSPMRPL